MIDLDTRLAEAEQQIAKARGLIESKAPASHEDFYADWNQEIESLEYRISAFLKENAAPEDHIARLISVLTSKAELVIDRLG